MSKNKGKGNTKNNIFDLSQLVPNQKDIEIKKKSSNEIGNNTNIKDAGKTNEENIMDKGYVLVQKDQWGNIPIQSYIRYMKSNGEITKGGFVESIIPNINKNGERGYSIHLKSVFGKTFRWIVQSWTIEKLWVKLDSEDNAIQQVISNNNLTPPIPVTAGSTMINQYPLQPQLQQPILQAHQIGTHEIKCCEFDKVEIDIMKDDIIVCKKTIEGLKKELQRVQSENVRIVTFLKKLNERK